MIFGKQHIALIAITIRSETKEKSVSKVRRTDKDRVMLKSSFIMNLRNQSNAHQKDFISPTIRVSFAEAIYLNCDILAI